MTKYFVVVPVAHNYIVLIFVWHLYDRVDAESTLASR